MEYVLLESYQLEGKEIQTKQDDQKLVQVLIMLCIVQEGEYLSWAYLCL